VSHFVRRAVNPKRPKVEPIRNPTLFPMEKLEETVKLASELKIERPYSLPGILLGTSAFTADGWQGSFYLVVCPIYSFTGQPPSFFPWAGRIRV
jgi:hypothetical protein